MEEINLSIIIPVYNVENYIQECLDSVLSQSLNNCEIILVDDGSTDKSGIICDDYANKYDSISVIHQENKGLSGARNSGIKIAKGEYLMFIDSDDFIYSKIDLKKNFSNLNEDIIQYKYIYYYTDTNKLVFINDMQLYDSMTYTDILFNKVKESRLSISAWDKIVKRSLIIDNNLYFKEGLLLEDVEWSLRLYLKANSIKSINEDIYVYRQNRKNAITNNVNKKYVDSLYSTINYWYNYNFENEDIKKIFLNYLALQYIILCTVINKSNCDVETKRNIYEMKDILKYSQNYKVSICNKFSKIFGYRFTILLIKCYMSFRSKGFILNTMKWNYISK